MTAGAGAVPGLRLRSATEADVAPMLAIYRPHVEEGVVSFETELPTPEAFAARVRRALEGWAWLVAEQDGAVQGYAYGSAHRERAAYRWSVETTVYVAPALQRRGAGLALYRALLDALAQRGFCQAYAGVTLPNPASVALHQAAGFVPIGCFPRVGHKFGRWHDVAWFHRVLREEPPSP